MLESTVWLLESVGLKARPFTQGRDFLDACEGGRHACVLPGMGGLNVQDELLARGIDLPVIFVAAMPTCPSWCAPSRPGRWISSRNPTTNNCCSTACSRPSIATPVGAGTAISTPGCANAWTASPRASATCRWCAAIPAARWPSNWKSAEDVDLYRARVMKRMQAQTLPELVGMAIAAGLVDPLRLREDA